jgi:hypothetical protein
MAIIEPYISQVVRAGLSVALKIHNICWRTIGNGQLKALSVSAK